MTLSRSVGSKRASQSSLLKTLFFLIILTALFTGTASAEVITVTTAPYGENQFDYSNGIITNNDGITYERDIDGTIIINDERYLAFAMRGDRGNGIETFTSMDFTWTWDVEQVGDDYIFRASNGNSNFLWEQTWYFYHDFGTPMKIEHYIENNLGTDITDMQMFYLITVDETDCLEYNETVYNVIDYTTTPLHKTGNFNNQLASVDFNDIFGFNFNDLIDTGFDINEIYIGNSDFLGYPDKNIMAVGFTKDAGIFPDGFNVTIDPVITAKPDTYAVSGHYLGELLSENAYSTGFEPSDIGTYSAMSTTQYTALSTDDTSYASSAGTNKLDGYIYVNFEVLNVDSINSFDVTIIGRGDEHWYWGIYNDVTDKWITMGDTTTYNTDVEMSYLVEGAEIATYSELVGNTASFSVALWESDAAAGIVNGDLISVTFDYEETPSVYFIPPDPISLSNTTELNWINYTWSAGSGNITDSYNVSYNGTWDNSSSNTFRNESVSGHGHLEIIVYAYNSSDSGALSTGYLTDNVTLSNNVITITGGTPNIVDEEETVNVDFDATDIDDDTPTFSCNRTDLFADFNTATGVGSWTTELTDTGIYSVDFGVADGYGSTDNYTMSINVGGNEKIVDGSYTSWGYYIGTNLTENLNDETVELDLFMNDYISRWDRGILDWNKTSGNNGTLSNGAVFNDTGLYLDGNDDMMNAGSDESIDDIFNGGATIVLKFNMSSWGADDRPYFIAKYAAGAGDWIFWGENASGEREFKFTNDFDEAVGVWNWMDEITVNTDMHVALTYDSDSVLNDPILYVNGNEATLDQEQVVPLGTDESDAAIDLIVGRRTLDLLRSFQGKIHYILIFDEILTNDEINHTRDNNHTASGNITINYTAWLDADEELVNLSYSGSDPTAEKEVNIFASTLDVTYDSIQSDAAIDTKYDVSGSDYEYGRFVLTTSNLSVTPVIYNITGEKDEAGEPPTGDNYYANASEVVTFTDTVTITKISAPVTVDNSDTITVSDTVSVIKTIASILYNAYVEETVSITDTVTITKIVAPIIYEIYEDEIITITDNIDVNKILAPIMYYTNISDTVTITDGLVMFKTIASVMYVAKVEDTISITDSVGITKTIAPALNKVNLSDTVTISDNIAIDKTTAGIVYNINLTDTITFDDGSVIDKTLAGINYSIIPSDTISITDSIDITKTLAAINYSFTPSDTISITDNVVMDKTTAGIVYNVNISDTITFNDGSVMDKTLASVGYNSSIEDAITVTDSISINKITAAINYSSYLEDTISISDSVTIDKTLAAINYSSYLDDTVTITDNVVMNKSTAGIVYSVDVSDTITFNDGSVMDKTLASVGYNSTAYEAITVSDTVSLEKTISTINYSINISDTISITDSIDITKTLAGINYSVDVSDTITITDNVEIDKTLAAINYSSTPSDTITITDSVSIEKTTAGIIYGINISDTITFDDGSIIEKTLASVDYNVSTPDTITLTDDISIEKTTAGINYSIDVSDTISVSDSINVTKTLASVDYNVSTPDTISVSDSVSIDKTTAGIVYEISVSDTVTFNDGVEVDKTLASVVYNISTPEEITFTDSVSINKSTATIVYTIGVADTVSITDSVYITKTLAGINYSVDVSDTITLTDVVSITKTLASVNYSSNVDDTISVTDSITMEKSTAGINYSIYVSDTITFNDGSVIDKTLAAINYSVTPSDTVTITDSVSINKTTAAIVNNIYISDTVTITDSVSIDKTLASVGYNVSTPDTISVSDSVSIIKTAAGIVYEISINDAISITDSIDITKTLASVEYNSTPSDTVTISDSVSIEKTTSAVVYNVTMSDTVSISDNVVISKTLASINYSSSADDSITVTDSITIEKISAGIVYSIGVADTVTFTENVYIEKFTSGSNYSRNVSDIVTIGDSIFVNKIVSNYDNFTFTNPSISSLTVEQYDYFTVSIDINDTDGTITDANVTINGNNYTMSNTAGDTWNYIFTETSVITRYEVEYFHAQDDLGAWNSTSSNLYTDVIGSGGSGGGGAVRPIIPAVTPIVTPIVTPVPTEEPVEDDINVTELSLNTIESIKRLLSDEILNIFKLNFGFKEKVYNAYFVAENATDCDFTSDVISGCDVENGVINISFKYDPDEMIYTHSDSITLYENGVSKYVEVDFHILNFTHPVWWLVLIIMVLSTVIIISRKSIMIAVFKKRKSKFLENGENAENAEN